MHFLKKNAVAIYLINNNDLNNDKITGTINFNFYTVTLILINF